MQQTTNYNLNIIERSDNILDSVDALGQNATTIDSALTGKISSTDIATTISSTSTNSQVAGAKAVYDATLDDYSTSERVVGTWIDGKPLYEKTIETNAPQVSTDGTESSINGVINANVDFAFIVAAFAKYNVSPYYTVWTMPYYNNSMRYIKSFTQIKSGTTRIWQIASSGTAYNSCICYLIIRYTKTTDTATRSLNLTRGTSTGSLVGMGDRTELTSLEVADTNVGEIPSEDRAEATVEEKTVEVEPIETLKEEKESGDTI